MPAPPAIDPALAAAWQTLLRAPLGDVLALAGQSALGPLLAEVCTVAMRRELERSRQYEQAGALLTTPAAPESDEIKGPEAAKILGLTAGTLNKRVERGDAEVVACVLGGDGKARRWSRARCRALRAATDAAAKGGAP